MGCDTINHLFNTVFGSLFKGYTPAAASEHLIKSMEASASSGNLQTASQLSKMYIEGELCHMDYKKAVEWHERAVSGG